MKFVTQEFIVTKIVKSINLRMKNKVSDTKCPLWNNILQILMKCAISLFIQFKITTRDREVRIYKVNYSHCPPQNWSSAILYLRHHTFKCTINLNIKSKIEEITGANVQPDMQNFATPLVEEWYPRLVTLLFDAMNSYLLSFNASQKFLVKSVYCDFVGKIITTTL